MINNLRSMLRAAQGKQGQPSGHPEWAHSAVDVRERPARLLRWLQCKKGSKVHMAMDTLRHLLAVQGTPANEQERA